MKDGGNESAVIRATEASVLGSRRLQVAVATDDKAYALFRSNDAKSANTPLKLDDPAVKDALDIFDGFKCGTEYNDSVSKNVFNRGTLKLNTEVLFDKIVAPALSKVLGDKNIALFSKAKATLAAWASCPATTYSRSRWTPSASLPRSFPILRRSFQAASLRFRSSPPARMASRSASSTSGRRRRHQRQERKR